MKWKTQGDHGSWLRRVESWAVCNPDPTAPRLAGEVGYVRGQALPCKEGATGLSRRIFRKKKKTLWGTLGNSPAATAPVSSPPHHPSGDCVHLISEGAETTGTTRGRLPSNRECAQQTGSAHTSSRRELRPQAPGRVQIKEGSAHTPIAWRRPTIKEWVEAGNTRTPPGRGNQRTKESPTDNNRRS